MCPRRTKTRFYNVKISEEAKIAAELIKSHYKPDMELQELLSLAVLEFTHVFYPQLEEEVGMIARRRQEARRGDGATHQAPG